MILVALDVTVTLMPVMHSTDRSVDWKREIPDARPLARKKYEQNRVFFARVGRTLLDLDADARRRLALPNPFDLAEARSAPCPVSKRQRPMW